jgi:hypothetical protein
MITKIKEDELIFFQTISHPINCAEILFHDFDSLGSWDTEKFGKVRLYQYPMISWDSLFIEDPKISKQDNWRCKNNLAESYNEGGRLTGKSIIAIIVDTLNDVFNKTFKWLVISSYDALHVRGIFEKIIHSLENHAVMRLLNSHVLRSPTYKINTGNNCLIESVNMNIAGKNPGGQFFGKHVDRHKMEESSFLTQEVSNKMLMAQSEEGCINRYSGMTTFSKQSPIGKIFFDLKNKERIVNLPSYVNPTWDTKKEEDSIIEFGGKESVGFKVQIEGRVVEDSDSVYDIERVRNTYNDKIDIKHFEITKDNFYRYKEIVIVEKLSNADKTLICADIGEGSAPTEIIIMFKVKDKYKYVYNISATRLSADEQYELFRFIIEAVNANVIALDTTSGMGKAIASRLTKDYPENIVWVNFNEKIRVDFEKDEKGGFITDAKGNYAYKEEYCTDWSITRLKHLFYNGLIECYMDYKLDLQFGGIVATNSGLRTIYSSKTANHLHQAFQCFSVAEWQTEFSLIKPIVRRKPGFGTFGSK